MKNYQFIKSRIIWICCLGILFTACASKRAGEAAKPMLPADPYASRLYDYYYAEAVKQRILGNNDAAFSLMQYCAELNPDAGEALYQKALYQIYLGEDSVAEQLLLRAAALEPKNIWYRETLSSYYLNQGKWAEAQKYLEEMAHLNPKRTDVLVRLTGLYQQDQKYDKAIEVLDRMETLEGKDIQISMEKFWLYMQLKKKDKAYEELKSLCREYPNDLSYRVLLANQYLANEDVDSARVIYEEVEALEPENVALRVSLLDYAKAVGNDSLYQANLNSLLLDENADGKTKIEVMRAMIAAADTTKEQTARVEELFQKVLAQEQKDAGMLTLYAAYQTMRKDGDDEISATLRRILEVEPGNLMALQELLRYQIQARNFDEIVRICDGGLQYHPNMLLFHFYKGMALFSSSRSQEAIKALELGVSLEKEEKDYSIFSDMYSILGDIYYNQGQKDKAYSAYDSSLTYNRNNVGCLNNYAYYLSLDGKDLDKAQNMSYQTIMKEPNNVTYLDTYAWILFLKKDYKEAKVYMDQIISIYEKEAKTNADKENQESVNGSVLEHAGDVYYQCGEHEKALDLWKKALQQMDGTTPLLKKKIEQGKYIEP